MSRTNLVLILTAAVAGAAAGAGASALFSSEKPAALAAPADGSAASLEPRLAALASSQEAMERALADVRSSLALLEARAQRTPLESGATDALAEPVVAEPVVEAAAPTAKPASVEDLLARLDAPGLSDSQRQMLWEEARLAGMTDALVAAMEQRVEREPNNPDLRLDLGRAYLQKTFAAGNGPMAGVWATKADKAFDTALELDPQHWEARFQKAVSLSFWPAPFGKQGVAIGEFQTLIAQQDAGPKEAHHAHTYFFLGNMYQETGAMDKAVETWQKGLDLFPDNKELKKQLAGAKQF